MFAIAFDLIVAEAEKSHPKGFSQAYADIGQLLKQFGFERVQGSLYVTATEDMANLFSSTVRDIRAFRLEQWSDFTPLMKQP